MATVAIGMEVNMKHFRDFMPKGKFEKSVVAAAEEAARHFAAADVGAWPILPGSGN